MDSSIKINTNSITNAMSNCIYGLLKNLETLTSNIIIAINTIAKISLIILIIISNNK